MSIQVGTKSAADILRGIHKRTDVPLSAMIEISDRCNEVCVHCYQVQGQKGEMTTAEVKRVLDDLADLGVLMLTISGGEATLRRDFLEILAHARACGFAVTLFTNGLTMTRQLAQALRDHAVREVQISVYSHRASTHDWITGVRGSWRRTIRGIKYLRAANVAVVVKSPIFSLTADDLQAYLDMARRLDAKPVLSAGPMSPREDGDRTPERFNAERSSVVKSMTLLKQTSSGSAPSSRKVVEPPTGPTRRPEDAVCGACRVIHIEPNGALRPCTNLDMTYGDARKGVSQAYESSELRRSIAALSWGDVHGCRECDLRDYCNRCFATALDTVGDALAPYREACQVALATYEAAHANAPVVRSSANTDDAQMGPYRRLPDGSYERFAYSLTARDVAFAERHPWVRRTPAAQAEGRVMQGALIQIRRPGRTKNRTEQVPGPMYGTNRKHASPTS